MINRYFKGELKSSFINFLVSFDGSYISCVTGGCDCCKNIFLKREYSPLGNLLSRKKNCTSITLNPQSSMLTVTHRTCYLNNLISSGVLLNQFYSVEHKYLSARYMEQSMKSSWSKYAGLV